MRYAAKMLVFVVTAVLGSNVAAGLLSESWSDPVVLWGVGVTALGAVVMFLKANTPTQPGLKRLVGLFTVVALAIISAATDRSFSVPEIAQIIVAFVGALATGTVENEGDALSSALAAEGRPGRAGAPLV